MLRWLSRVIGSRIPVSTWALFSADRVVVARWFLGCAFGDVGACRYWDRLLSRLHPRLGTTVSLSTDQPCASVDAGSLLSLYICWRKRSSRTHPYTHVSTSTSFIHILLLSRQLQWLQNITRRFLIESRARNSTFHFT